MNRKTQTPYHFKLSHPDKVFWPKERYTKKDLFDYYKVISSFILPYLKDRPETLRRYPNGIDKPAFFQKQFEKPPKWVHTEHITHDDRDVNYYIVDDEESLLYLINLGCIDLNPFNSRLKSLEYPDYMVLDLDPENIDFDAIIEVALILHQIFEKIDIPHFCKTSGARGMHVYVPMGAKYTFDQVKHFGQLMAHLGHRRLPRVTSVERSPSKRQKRVYLDYLQNNFGQTVAAPYSVRPKPGATVSTPLKWSEVESGLTPSQFTIENTKERLEKVGDLFKPVLGQGIDLEATLKKLEKFII